MDLNSALSIGDMQRLAAQRLPRMIFDFLEGGAEDEVTARANLSAWDELTFSPQALVDVADRDTTVHLGPGTLRVPLVLGPAGLGRLFHPDGEIAVAKAAAAAGVPYVLNPFSSVTIEEAREQTSADLWFETRAMPDSELASSLLRRAEIAEYSTVVFMSDIPANGKLERQFRSGFQLPPKYTARNVLDGARHPRWALGFLRALRDLYPMNISEPPPRTLIPRMPSPALFYSRIATPSGTWADFRRTRDAWPGRLVIKGIMSAADAVKAVEAGADAVVVSNFGGRQLDGLPPSLYVLPEVVSAVAGRADVLIDGGIRRGGHIAKALALGATACLVTRPYHYGLAVAGSSGVARVIDIFREELDRCLAMLGCRTPADLDLRHVRTLPAMPQLRERT